MLVSGRWKPTSGVHEAQWAIVAAVPDDEGAEPRMALIPMHAGSIEESWHMAGMQGTATPLSLEVRARVRMEVATAARCARDVVDRALSLAGHRSFDCENPLQLLWRDGEVALRHLMMSYERSLDLYAQGLFGIASPNALR